MKKTNIVSMLAIAGGLALTTAACSPPAEDAATEADAMSVEEEGDAMADDAMADDAMAPEGDAMAPEDEMIEPSGEPMAPAGDEMAEDPPAE